jgi:aspartyl/glutamyl-tRNA(Asn/Gln) amidotransferase C subunit
MSNMNSGLVTHIAKLAQIPITKKEEKDLAEAFSKTLNVVDQLQELDVKKIEPIHQVTGLVNITRKDIIEKEKMFSQAEALKNAPLTYDGFFMVERIINVK